MTRHTLTIGLLFLTGLSVQAERVATRVAAAVRPSVVEISTLDGHGTGVVIRRDGLILTNKHVAESLILFAAKAHGDGGKADEAVIYRDVRLLKAHPRLDLALVQVDAPGVRFTPLDVRSRPKVVTGMECYVVGVPTGEPSLKALNISVTEGLVSAAKVTLPAGEFIQTTAPINPGNSGGPLCSAKGEVLGIVTAKLMGADNIGFAIPAGAIRLDDFEEVDFHQAPAGTVDEAVAAIEKKVAAFAPLSGPDRVTGVREVIRDYAALIRDHGPQPDLMNRLGQLHLMIEHRSRAAVCFDDVLRREPGNITAIWHFGATVWDLEQPDLAIETWDSLLDTDPPSWAADSRWAALSLSGIGRGLLQQGRHPAAGYCFLWARTLSPDVVRNPIFPEDLEKVLQQAAREDASMAGVIGEPGGFSLQELRRLMKLTPGKDRLDRYATTLSGDIAGGESPPTGPSRSATFEVRLPDGASQPTLRNAKPGMSINADGTRITWDKAPATHGAMKVMVFYQIDGRSAYQLVEIPASHGVPDE